jgi:AbiV family abortive infection protein
LSEQIIIKKEELKNIFEKLEKHIQRLFKDVEILYENERYVGAIPIIIIIFEETSKMNSVLQHINENTDITKSEWLELTKPKSHIKKLTQIYENAKQGYDKMSETKRIELQQLLKNLAFPSFEIEKESHSQDLSGNADKTIENLEIFNEIKKLALYFDWRENRALTLENMIPNNIGHLANFLYHVAKLQYVLVLLNHKYSFYFYTVPKEVNIMVNDPLWKELDDTYHYIQSEDYEISLKIAYSIIFEIKSFSKFMRLNRSKYG